MLLYPDSIKHQRPPILCASSDDDLLKKCHHFAAEHNLTAFILLDNEPKKIVAIRSEKVRTEQICLVIMDPSLVTLEPGWPLRNLLAGIAFLR